MPVELYLYIKFSTFHRKLEVILTNVWIVIVKFAPGTPMIKRNIDWPS